MEISTRNVVFETLDQDKLGSRESLKMDTDDEFSNVEIIDSTVTDVRSSPILCKCKSKDRKSLRKKKKKASNSIQKNALMQLNEFQPGLKYVVEAQVGPPHNSHFKVSVIVNGRKYIGRGTSKKKAKLAAAQAALPSVAKLQNTPKARHVSIQNAKLAAVQAALPSVAKFQNKPKARHVSIQNADIVIFKAFENKGCNFHDSKMMKKMNLKNKFEVMLLNGIHPGITYNLIEENPGNPPHRFKMSIEINGQTYEGTGRNKKSAKASVARAVLSSLYNASHSLFLKDLLPESYLSAFPQAFADKISGLVMGTFSEVMSDIPEHTKWKVIAGIAMTKDAEMDDVQIVSIGTGAKCVSGEHINMCGGIINDCHAEIISRRCLKHFFYTNLELLLQGKDYESIFTERAKGGFCLKPHIKFHLYISTAPCGDARIFSSHEENFDVAECDADCSSPGVLRTKIESGEGTIPVTGDLCVQTWDSILLGEEKLLTMSCSDKIASWNVLGLQGALLSHFIEPIYLDSVILGGLFYPNHLCRALYARIEDHVKGLPPLYRINKPQLYATTGPEIRHLTKPPNYSVNWSVHLGRPEIINAITGKIKNGQVSRLAKRSFFQRFINIYHRIPHIDTFETPDPPLYDAFKASVKNYRNAQIVLEAAFIAAGLGHWVKKPAEQEYYEFA